jgi:dTDP-4-amino-4,6-dideoxygalactose transaminase
MIPINAPHIGREEIEAVKKVLESGILTSGLGTGPMVREFEKKFCRFVKAKHAIAVNSGTAALHMALLVAEVKIGDEVILPSFTFTATAETVVLTGARPVFVDIDPHTYTIQPEEIEKAITQKTKAIIPVDLYGLSAEMKAIHEIAEKHDLVVIEDAAQAHGATYHGKPPGFYADFACWSFYASKNMTTGEGGMVTTNSEEYAEKLRCVRTHGEKEKYTSVLLGHNYRMPEIEAAIGIVQLKKLPKFLDKRRKNAETLSKKLGEASKLRIPKEPRGFGHSWYLYTVRLEGANASIRDKLIIQLKERGIGIGVYYDPPIHLMPFYRRFKRRKLVETEKASKQVFSLPVHPGVTAKQVKFIADCVLELL